MTKGFTRLATHNSSMVAPHEQNYEGGWTIYHTKKSHRTEKQPKSKSLSFFYTYLDNLPKYTLFSASSTTGSTSTSTKTLFFDIVKGIIHKPHPSESSQIWQPKQNLLMSMMRHHMIS